MKKDNLREHFRSFDEECGSPIEAMLSAAIIYTIGLSMYEQTDGGLDFAFQPFRLSKQEPIAGFHVDLALKGEGVRVAIECDGHAFHEKTKDQVAKDKARERAIVEAGYVVIRFSGSEIWNDPMACASQAFIIARNQQSDAAEAFYNAQNSTSK